MSAEGHAEDGGQAPGGIQVSVLAAWTMCPDRCQVSAGQPVSASQVVLVGKNLLLMQETQETQLGSLGEEDPLEEGMEARSRRGMEILLPGGSRGRRSLVGHGPQGRKESDTTE